MSTDAQHPFICLWALCKSSLEKCLFRYFDHFIIGLFVFLERTPVFFIYFWDQTLVWGMIGKYIFLYGWFPFHFADIFFSHAEAFYFGEASFVLSFMSLALGDISVEILLHEISEILLAMFSSRNFMVSQLIFQSFTHLEFILVYGICLLYTSDAADEERLV